MGLDLPGGRASTLPHFDYRLNALDSKVGAALHYISFRSHGVVCAVREAISQRLFGQPVKHAHDSLCEVWVIAAIKTTASGVSLMFI